jgi:predicted negative regulator of RcsB-dependent stress response
MPSSTHRKLTRKELKQPDEFETLLDDIGAFFVNNLQQILIASGIILAVGAIVASIYFYEHHRDETAGNNFYAALQQLKSNNYKAAAASFEALAEAEPNRRVGHLAHFYLASAYIGENDLPKARDALVQFVAEEHDPLYTNLALTNLGVIYERMGDFRKAAGAYGQAASVSGPEQQRAELSVARVLAKAGDKSGAIAAYRGFLAGHPFAQQRSDALESLAMLGAQPERNAPGLAAPIAAGAAGVAAPVVPASPAAASAASTPAKH